MALGDIVGVPEALIGRIETLVLILQAVGVFVILYIIFNFINAIINTRRNKRIDKISKDVEEIKLLLSEKKFR